MARLPDRFVKAVAFGGIVKGEADTADGWGLSARRTPFHLRAVIPQAPWVLDGFNSAILLRSTKASRRHLKAWRMRIGKGVSATAYRATYRQFCRTCGCAG